MPRPPQVLELVPSAMVAGGDAIARAPDGRVVFVAGALPGERVAVEIIGGGRDFRRGRAVEVRDAAEHRVAVPCPHVARGCGGCQWQHISLEGQREFKRDIVVDALRRLGRVDPARVQQTVALPADGYRTTVRAAVIDGRLGFREGKGHDVVAVDSCLVAHPLLTELIVDGRYGGATEVVLRCGARTLERLAAPTPVDAPIHVPADVRRDVHHEDVAGRRWRISAESFFQARSDGADVLAEAVVAATEETGVPTTAIDLYAGVGLFAGVLADRGWSVTAVEGSAHAAADARANLRDTDCTVVEADVLQWTPATADVVVADPSRSGLGSRGVDVVAAACARRVVLVSCDAAALGRDAGLLAGAGYALTSATPVDLFPHTFHIEVVSVFDR